MARRNGIAGQLPFGAPVARDPRGIAGMLPLNAAPGIGGCRSVSVGVGAHKTGVSNLALSTRRHTRGNLGRMCKPCPDGSCIDPDLTCLPALAAPGGATAGRRAVALTYKGGGIGKSYASRLLGKGVTVDVTRTGAGSYSATITTEGKSMANKVLGNRIQMNGGRHENGYHGSVGVGAKKGKCYPGPQPCDEGREACSYSHYGVLKAGCRHSPEFQIPTGHHSRPKAGLSPAAVPPRRRRPPKAGLSPASSRPKADLSPRPSRPHADLSPVPSRRPSGIKRGRRGAALTLKAGR